MDVIGTVSEYFKGIDMEILLTEDRINEIRTEFNRNVVLLRDRNNIIVNLQKNIEILSKNKEKNIKNVQDTKIKLHMIEKNCSLCEKRIADLTNEKKSCSSLLKNMKKKVIKSLDEEKFREIELEQQRMIHQQLFEQTRTNLLDSIEEKKNKVCEIKKIITEMKETVACVIKEKRNLHNKELRFLNESIENMRKNNEYLVKEIRNSQIISNISVSERRKALEKFVDSLEKERKEGIDEYVSILDLVQNQLMMLQKKYQEKTNALSRILLSIKNFEKEIKVLSSKLNEYRVEEETRNFEFAKQSQNLMVMIKKRKDLYTILEKENKDLIRIISKITVEKNEFEKQDIANKRTYQVFKDQMIQKQQINQERTMNLRNKYMEAELILINVSNQEDTLQNRLIELDHEMSRNKDSWLVSSKKRKCIELKVFEMKEEITKMKIEKRKMITNAMIMKKQESDLNTPSVGRESSKFEFPPELSPIHQFSKSSSININEYELRSNVEDAKKILLDVMHRIQIKKDSIKNLNNEKSTLQNEHNMLVEKVQRLEKAKEEISKIRSNLK